MDHGSANLGFLLHDVARLMRKRFEQHARGLGLARSQWHALAYLSRNENISQTGLADLLDLEPITLSRIVDRLSIPASWSACPTHRIAACGACV